MMADRIEIIERLNYQIHMLENGEHQKLLEMLKEQLKEAQK